MAFGVGCDILKDFLDDSNSDVCNGDGSDYGSCDKDDAASNGHGNESDGNEIYLNTNSFSF